MIPLYRQQRKKRPVHRVSTRAFVVGEPQKKPRPIPLPSRLLKPLKRRKSWKTS
jgi:hypothetical protein